MEQEGRKYCEDCRFCQVPVTGIAHARCGEPRAKKLTGGSEFVAREFDRPTYAATARTDTQQCGPSAAWFQAKPANEAEAA